MIPAHGFIFSRQRRGSPHCIELCRTLQLERAVLPHLTPGDAILCLQLDLASLEYAQIESQGDRGKD